MHQNKKLFKSVGVWSPGQKQELYRRPTEKPADHQKKQEDDDPISPIWTPKSATSSPIVERKEFRPVKFESPVLNRKNYEETSSNTNNNPFKEPPWNNTEITPGVTQSSNLPKRLPTSHSSPASGFSDFSARLPRAQNPTITLLQKARGK